MNVTAFSFITGVLWCNIFIVFLALLRRDNRFIVLYGMLPIFMLIALCTSRLLCMFELPGTIVIRSTIVFPAVMTFFMDERALLSGHSLLSLLFLIWGVGTVFLLLKHFVQETNFLRYVKTKGKDITASFENQNFFIKLCNTNASFSKVRIFELSEIGIPFTAGYFHPTIFFPAFDFSEEELHVILLHEWTHFKQKDLWLKTAMFLVCACFWWNPFVYIFKNNFDHILEVRCDLKVTRNMNDSEKIKYLSSITHIIEINLESKKNTLSKLCSASPLINIAGENQIAQRFNIVLSENVQKRCKVGTLISFGVFIFIFIFSHMFVLQPATLGPKNLDVFTLTPDNAYIIQIGPSAYSVYADEIFRFKIDSIDNPPFSELPLLEEEIN